MTPSSIRPASAIVFLGVVVALAACDTNPNGDAAKHPKRVRNAALYEDACSGVREVWSDIGSYFGGQPVKAALTHSLNDLNDAIDALASKDESHLSEFGIAATVARAYIDSWDEFAGTLMETDFGSIWGQNLEVVARTCREAGVPFDLPEGG